MSMKSKTVCLSTILMNSMRLIRSRPWVTMVIVEVEPILMLMALFTLLESSPMVKMPSLDPSMSTPGLET